MEDVNVLDKTGVGITGERGGGLRALLDFLFDGLPLDAGIIA